MAISFLSLGEHVVNRAVGWFHRCGTYTYVVCDHLLLYTVVLSIAVVTDSFLFSLLFFSELFFSQLRISAFLSLSPEGVGGKGPTAWVLISSWL